MKSASLLSLSHSPILVWSPLPFSPIAFPPSSNTLEMGEKTLKTEVPTSFLVAGVQKEEGELYEFLQWGKPVVGIHLLKSCCTMPKSSNLSVPSHQAGCRCQKLQAEAQITNSDNQTPYRQCENTPKAFTWSAFCCDCVWVLPLTSSASEGALHFLLSLVTVRN